VKEKRLAERDATRRRLAKDVATFRKDLNVTEDEVLTALGVTPEPEAKPRDGASERASASTRTA
jgi:hypothetical protein